MSMKQRLGLSFAGTLLMAGVIVTVTSFQESIQSRGPGATDSVSFDFRVITITDFGQPPNRASITWDVTKNSLG